jgi:hypothetical protein
MVALLPGNAHEAGPLYQLVEQFVRTAGNGVMKWLILDRGFIDGQQISRCQRDWGIEVVIPVRKDMDLWTDAWALAAREHWSPLPVEPRPEVPIPAARPEHRRRREAKRQQTLAQNKQQLPAPPAEERYTHSDYCWIGGFNSWTAATVPISVVCMYESPLV